MKISHYLELEDRVLGGIKESVKNQRMAMDKAGVDYVTSVELSSEVWHLNLVGPKSFLYALTANLLGKKLVLNVHTTKEDFEESFRLSGILSYPLYLYLKVFYSRADLLIVPSDYTAEIMKDYGFSTGKISVLSNGVDTSKFEDLESFREDARQKYDLEGDVVFCVGSVFERKGVGDFIETAERLPEKEFVWFGKVFPDKVMDKELQNSIENSPENVQFTGYVDDIREAFSAGDIFFYPTKTENQGIPALEAAYCGKPIILRDIQPFERDFEHEENCLKGSNLEEFRDSIERICSEEELSERLVTNAEEMVEEHTLEVVGERLKDVYESLLERRA